MKTLKFQPELAQLILDGLHRLMKSYILKMDMVHVRKIPRNKIADILG